MGWDLVFGESFYSFPVTLHNGDRGRTGKFSLVLYAIRLPFNYFILVHSSFDFLNSDILNGTISGWVLFGVWVLLGVCVCGGGLFFAKDDTYFLIFSDLSLCIVVFKQLFCPLVFSFSSENSMNVHWSNVLLTEFYFLPTIWLSSGGGGGDGRGRGADFRPNLFDSG